MMQITASDLRRNLSRTLDEVAEGRTPIVVTRSGARENVVLISETEFIGWQETAHLLASPRNAERLLAAIRSADAGLVEPHDLLTSEPRTPKP